MRRKLAVDKGDGKTETMYRRKRIWGIWVRNNGGSSVASFARTNDGERLREHRLTRDSAKRIDDLVAQALTDPNLNLNIVITPSTVSIHIRKT